MTTLGSSAEHDRIVRETLLLLGKEASHLGRFFRNETGAAYRNGKLIHYGTRGSPDIIGIIQGGKYIGIEIKSGKATQSQIQLNFEKMVKSFQGHYFVARSASQALGFILGIATNCN